MNLTSITASDEFLNTIVNPAPEIALNKKNPPLGISSGAIDIDGRKAVVDPPIALVPVKNGLPKTTDKPLAEVPDCKGVDIILPPD